MAYVLAMLLTVVYGDAVHFTAGGRDWGSDGLAIAARCRGDETYARYTLATGRRLVTWPACRGVAVGRPGS